MPGHSSPSPVLEKWKSCGTFSAKCLLHEVKARHVARQVYGLRVVGTARLLVEAKRASLIPAIHPLLLRMRDNGYWISDKIIAEIRRQAGE